MEQRKGKKRKGEEQNQEKRKRPQLLLRPQFLAYSEDDATLPIESSGVSTSGNQTVGDLTMIEMEEPGEIVSDDNSLSDLSDEESYPHKETDPLREDMPIVGTRWTPEEVDALMTALNVNRDAIKFHFRGAGGGKDVKRQGWRDVAGYVNDVADTHRTVRQCRDKASDFTQRCKAKFNKLRYAIATTGKGKIKRGLKLKPTEGKALDYLREEAVKGIPGIDPMPLPEENHARPSKSNKKMLWRPDRDDKPEYSQVDMKKEGVPNNYRDKNNRRLCRLDKAKRKEEHKKQMLKLRKKEKKELRKRKVERVRERAEERELRRVFKMKRKKDKEDRRRRKEEKKEKKERKMLKKKEKKLKRKERELSKKENKRAKKHR